MDPKAHKKALIREYKETRRPMGAYRILNSVSGKALVGVSANLPAILNRHQAQLRLGSHANRALQEDWNALGPDAFVFEVLDTLSPSDEPNADPSDDLRTLEQLWLERLSPFDERGYNAKPKATA
jgi:hypothetical protein